MVWVYGFEEEGTGTVTVNFHQVWCLVCSNQVTHEILDFCDQRRDLKKTRGEPEGARDYREIKRKIKTEMKMPKETWIQGQCQEVEACLRKNNSKKAYQLVKDLTTEKQEKTTATQGKSGKCLTEENEILNRWTEYCSDLYNYETEWDPIVLDCPQIPDAEHHPILREEVEAAVKLLTMGKSAGVDNISAELVQAGGEAMIDILTTICTKIWKTGEWPTTWTQSLVNTLPKKGNLQLCQNYRIISIISHPSKIMLKIQPQAEEQKRSLQKSKQVSGPEGAKQNKYSISGSSARNTGSISRISTMSS